MAKSVKKSKMTLDKLAGITQDQFLATQKDMDKGFSGLRTDMQGLRTDMQDGFSTIHKEIVG